MVKPQGHSAHHPINSSSSSAPEGSLSKGAKVAIIIAAVLVGLLIITFCYYAIQERRRARNEQDIFSCNRVTRKTLSAAVHLWIFLPVSRVLKRRSVLKVDHEDKPVTPEIASSYNPKPCVFGNRCNEGQLSEFFLMAVMKAH
ncbi:hypothetical protein BKA60DRAFT_546142 [Fusarium oxysporum]|nr:hypothetical protein BKA60DRAFT_546142 [Fusarium oxysporum]